jgi:AcrR family transcriptional regulator
MPVAATDHVDLKQAILAVSLQLGTELGEEGLTMRAIARRLGVSATALYQHFDSKGAILRAIRFDGLDKLAGYLDPAFELDSPVDRIREHSIRYLGFARDNPWLYSVLLDGEEIGWQTMSDDERVAVLRSGMKVQQTLETGCAEGCFRADLDIRIAPLMLWAALHGFALLLLRGRVANEDPQLGGGPNRAVIDLFVDGLVRSLCP